MEMTSEGRGVCGGLGSSAVRLREVVLCLCTWENVRGGMRIEKGMANVSSGPEWILSTVPLDGQSVCLFICFFFFSVLSFGTAVVLLTRQAPVEFAMSYFQKVFLEK